VFEKLRVNAESQTLQINERILLDELFIASRLDLFQFYIFASFPPLLYTILFHSLPLVNQPYLNLLFLCLSFLFILLDYSLFSPTLFSTYLYHFLSVPPTFILHILTLALFSLLFNVPTVFTRISLL
jgi:hypothetical protein